MPARLSGAFATVIYARPIGHSTSLKEKRKMKWQKFVAKGCIKSVGFYFALFCMLCVTCQALALPVAKISSAGQGTMSGQKPPSRHQEQHPMMDDDDGGPGNCQPNVITFSQNPVSPGGNVTVTVSLFYPAPATGCSVSLTWSPYDDFTCQEPNCTVLVGQSDINALFTLTAANLQTKTKVMITATTGGYSICSYITIGSGVPYPSACTSTLIEAAIHDADDALELIHGIRRSSTAMLNTIDQANMTLTSIAALIDRISARNQQQAPPAPQTPTPPP